MKHMQKIKVRSDADLVLIWLLKLFSKMKIKKYDYCRNGKVIDASVIYASNFNDSHKPTCESPSQTG
jgi:hypothetical protein